MRMLVLTMLVGMLGGASPAFAQSAPAVANAAAPMSSSTTTIGALLENPASRAILEREIPNVISHPMLNMALGMTLQDLRRYEPILTDEKLASIDAALAAL